MALSIPPSWSSILPYAQWRLQLKPLAPCGVTFQFGAMIEAKAKPPLLPVKARPSGGPPAKRQGAAELLIGK